MGDAVLTATNLSKRYGGVLALDHVNLAVHTGEVHGLVGENGSGKSTLVKILTGVVHLEPGALMTVGGESVRMLTPANALRRGVQVVHQDLSLFSNLSVAENIAITRYAESGRKLIHWRLIRRMANDALRRLVVQLPLEAPVRALPVADQQLVAICRAIASDAKVLIMDEPTASLTRREVDRLFKVLRDLQGQGLAVLFISHKLDEVLEIAQTVTVLRDGHRVGTFARPELTRDRLTELMTGRQIAYARVPPLPPVAPVVLDVQHLTKRGQYADLTFAVRRGEILGIIGPLGSGRTELALSLFGMNPPDSGTVRLDGKPLAMAANADAIRTGIAYVPEDRLTQGLVANQPVATNLIVTAFDRLVGRFGLLDPQRRREFAGMAVREFDIRTPSLDTPARALSGGNQQKTVIAKWLSSRPKILILDGPTIGVDVAAKGTIYAMIQRLTTEGVSVLLISEEIPEVLANCHRILVMTHGRIVAEFAGAQVTEDQLVARIAG
jgi:simple sugar transport system ATP-binding protein